MSATIRQIVDDALTIVGEVAGPGVQLYEEDRMMADAVRGFNMMFKKYEWDQYVDYFTITLDGSTGIATTGPFAQVKDFEDFIAVFRGGESFPLPTMKKRTNINSLGLTGTVATFWASLPVTNILYNSKKLRFWPVTSVGNIDVIAKVYPLVPPATQFTWADTFYLDRDMLAYATAFMTLSGDDLNAGAADVVRNLMEMKYKDVMAALGKHPIPLSTNSTIPSYWSERY